MARVHQTNSAVCRCGETKVELLGEPILSTICYCESCRTAARGFEQELGAPKTVRDDGGVDYCLYRKDRVRIAQGAHHLREHRLKPDSPTRRVVAHCCDSPMFVDFTRGHWLTVYRRPLSGQAPQPEMRVMTKDRLEGVDLSETIPSYATVPPRAIIKLLAAWAAMGFSRPEISW